MTDGRSLRKKRDRPSWTGGVAAPKAQTGWWFKLDVQNFSILNNHPGASRHPSWPGGAIPLFRIVPIFL
jgi:hypothetical protein